MIVRGTFSKSDIAKATVGLRNIQEEINDNLREWVAEGVRSGADLMRARVPRKSGLLETAIRVSDVSYRAGGLGGGGSWVASVDIDPFVAPHYRFVMFGTGLFREDGGPRGRIQARGNVMAFDDAAGSHFFMSQKGQKAQREWFDSGVDLANELMRAHAQHDRPFRARFDT